MNISAPINKKQYSEWMDQFRWLAAFVVVISHVGGPVLVSLSAMPADQRPLLQYLYSFIAGFAHPAVMIFFVMSGYFVGGSLCVEVQRNRKPDALMYFLKRFTRLWIVLIPTLIISYFLYEIGSKLSPVVYSAAKFQSTGLETFLCNLLFLQNVSCLRYAGNDSLWSLFNEFWYYVAFFGVVYAVTAINSIFYKIILLIAVAASLVWLTIAQFSNAPLLPYAIVWLAGVYVAYAKRPRYLVRPTVLMGVLVLYLSVVRVWLGADGMHGTTLISFFADMGTTFLFTQLLVHMKFDEKLSRPLGGNANNILAGFSYTLYCIHLPLTSFFCAVMMYLFGTGFEMVLSSYLEWTILFSCLITVVLVSYVVSLFTERYTNQVRDSVYGLVVRSKSA